MLGACSSATGADRAPTDAIEIGPEDPSVALLETLQLTAIVRDGNGHPVAGLPVFWSSGDTDVATVSQSGVVTPKRLGEVDIAASAEGRSGLVRVRVLPKKASRVVLAPSSSSATVGDTVPLQVVVEAADGERLTDRTVTFASTAPTVADVDDDGRAVARAPGSASLVARVEDVADTSRITVTQAAVASLDVSPSAPTLIVGQSVTLRVTLRDSRGRTLEGRSVSFSSSRTSVATVNGDGIVTARAVGDATITVSAGGKSRQVKVTVSPVPLAQLTVSPTAFTLRSGEQRQLTATLRDARGEVVTGRTITWSSSAPLVASVSSSGLVRGLLPGAAVITARIEELEASAGVSVALVPVQSVNVSPSSAQLTVGERRTLDVTATDEAGQPATGRAVIWRSSNSDVASVSSTGEVLALKSGGATITASVDGVEDAASITVAAPSVGTVAVSPSSVQLAVGGSRQLSATVRDGDGDVLTGRTVSWSSSNRAVATVSGSGEVQAVSAGEASIAATVDGVVGTAAVTVEAAPIASVTVAPSSATLEVGGTRQLSATVRDADGQTVAGASVSWRSSDGDVASVGSNGLVTAKEAGSATITASAGGASGTATITVNAPEPTVGTVTVSPSSATVEIGATRQLSATVRSTLGEVITGLLVNWTSSDGSVASVSGSGVVTAKAPGDATITASVLGISSSASITVPEPPPAVASVEVSPGNFSIDEGESRQLTARVRDAQGREMQGVTVTWRSSDSDVATVSSSGVVRGREEGRATITATAGGKSGTSSVRVREDDDDDDEVREPAALVRVSGDDQRGRRGQTLSGALVVRVLDDRGRPVRNTRLDWNAKRGGRITPSKITTDENGRAQVRWKLGNPVGAQSAVAVVTEDESLTVTFTAIATP